MTGKTISHYRIIEKLGSGGMGVVYKAEDLKLKRIVALKFLPQELTRDEESRQRFIHEAQAASSLQHNNICTIHDIDETSEGQTFICLDCYEGKTLKELINGKKLKLSEAVDVSIQISEGLNKAHSSGIVHRDIKPTNILITKDGIVKIIDFGLAKLTDRSQMTRVGDTLGTAAYMSPEQAMGEKVDHRTDIWSLGIVLYEMLTGELPFKSEYEQATIYSILNQEPESISNINPDVPKMLESIAVKAIRKDRGERYQQIIEILDDLKTVRESLNAEILKKNKPVEKTIPSIAVLPFANLSADPENEYFSDGMSEEIINALTKLNGLHVVARTSAFAFKGKNEDIREIGKKLHVEHVLEGSVRKSGNRLRITAQLIKIADGYHLWSERFDRTMNDIFVIQDEISLSIAEKLKVTLLENEKNAIVKRSTENLEAYNLFLQGKYAANKSTRESIEIAIKKFEEAIALSPDYALAYAEMATQYYYSGLMNLLHPNDAYPKAKVLAEKAIEIDPMVSEAYAVLATIKYNYEWDWEGAQQGFKKAVELNSNNAGTRGQYGFYFLCLGKISESFAELASAYSLDPLYDPTFMGLVLLRTGRLKEARDQFLKSIDEEPTRVHARWLIGHIDVLEGRYEEGFSHIRKALSLSNKNEMVLAAWGWSNAFAGNRNEAVKAIDELFECSKHKYVSPYYSAKIYAALGENDNAFEWLEKAYIEHDTALVAVFNDESLKGLYTDPRFDELLKKMKLKS